MSAHHRLSNHRTTEEILTDSSDALRDAAADLRAARVRYVNGVFTNTLRIIFTCQLLYVQRKEVRCPHNNWVSFIVNYLLMICNVTCLIAYILDDTVFVCGGSPFPSLVLGLCCTGLHRLCYEHGNHSLFLSCSYHFKLTCFRNEYVISTPALNYQSAKFCRWGSDLPN